MHHLNTSPASMSLPSSSSHSTALRNSCCAACTARARQGHKCRPEGVAGKVGASAGWRCRWDAHVRRLKKHGSLCRGLQATGRLSTACQPQPAPSTHRPPPARDQHPPLAAALREHARRAPPPLPPPAAAPLLQTALPHECSALPHRPTAPAPLRPPPPSPAPWPRASRSSAAPAPWPRVHSTLWRRPGCRFAVAVDARGVGVWGSEGGGGSGEGAAPVSMRYPRTCSDRLIQSAHTLYNMAARSKRGVACSHSPVSRIRSSEGVLSFTASLYNLSASLARSMAV